MAGLSALAGVDAGRAAGGVDPEALARKASAKGQDPEALRSAAREFESLFLHQLFKSMRQTVLKDEDSLLDAGMGGEMFTDMLDMEYAKQSAEQGGIGLAEIVAQQFGVEMNDAQSAGSHAAPPVGLGRPHAPQGLGVQRTLSHRAVQAYTQQHITSEMQMPVDGGRISSRFGLRKLADDENARMHQGLDIAASEGTPIEAARGGRVVQAGWVRGYGNTVVLDHGDGQTTLYGHASELLVKVGDKVTAGAHIAKVGSTGHSTGPHLHFEVRKDGRAQDPSKALGLVSPGSPL